MQRGFTLIELVVYIALFSIVIGGGMTAAYQLMSGTTSDTNHIILQEEANFLLRKINWALTGSTSFTTGSNLVVVKSGSPNLTFDLNNKNLRIAKGSSSPIILNSSSIQVSSLSFLNIGTSGVKTTFTLTTAQDGRNTSQTFSTTKYLRK